VNDSDVICGLTWETWEKKGVVFLQHGGVGGTVTTVCFPLFL
jgi:hypothetical protein